MAASEQATSQSESSAFVQAAIRAAPPAALVQASKSARAKADEGAAPPFYDITCCHSPVLEYSRIFCCLSSISMVLGKRKKKKGDDRTALIQAKEHTGLTDSDDGSAQGSSFDEDEDSCTDLQMVPAPVTPAPRWLPSGTPLAPPTPVALYGHIARRSAQLNCLSACRCRLRPLRGCALPKSPDMGTGQQG